MAKMRFYAKRAVCWMLAALLALQSAPLCAAELPAETWQEVESEAFTLVDSGVVTGTRVVRIKTFEASYAASALSGVNFGDQILSLADLTDSERENCKALYDALTTVTPDTSTLQINLPKPYVTTAATEEAQQEDMSEFVVRIAQTAVDAYLRDYPEHFWFSVEQTYWSYSYTGITESDGTKTQVITALNLVTAPSTDYDPVAEYQERFDTAAEEMNVDQTDRYHTVMSIHDAVCLNNTYNDGTYAHQAYAGLVLGESVCEGYAKAFKVMCDRYDVPCVLVSGVGVNSLGESEAHMWNYVQMEDGNWYGVDVTWDDASADKIYYDYFLVGENTIASHYGDMTFGESHVPNGDLNQQGIAVFAYPALSTETYVYSEYEPTEAPVEPTDEPVEQPSEGPVEEPTEGPVEEPTEEPVEEPVFYGDIDFDGEITGSDSRIILYAVVGLVALDEAQTKASDVDGDGEITSYDALYVLERVVKLIAVFPADDPDATALVLDMEYELTADGNTVYVSSVSGVWWTIPRTVIKWESDEEVAVYCSTVSDLVSQASASEMLGTIAYQVDEAGRQAVIAGAYIDQDANCMTYTGPVFRLVFEGTEPITVTADNGASVVINAPEPEETEEPKTEESEAPAASETPLSEIVKYDFENGTGMTSTGFGTDPQVVNDAQRGNVLQFADGASSEYVSSGVEGSDATLGVSNTRIDNGSPSSLRFDNPLCGRKINGATVSMWVKVPAGAAASAPGLVGFVSGNVSRPHPDQICYPDNPEAQRLQPSTGPYAFGITASGLTSADEDAQPMLNMAGLQHNWYSFFDEDATFAQKEDEWVYMTVSLRNGIYDTYVYINGQKVSCEQAGGKRYNKGELNAGVVSNTTEPTLLEILTMAEMKTAYVGYTGFSPTVGGVCIDDLTFYEGAASDDEALALYEAALATPTPEETTPPTKAPEETTAPTKTPEETPEATATPLPEIKPIPEKDIDFSVDEKNDVTFDGYKGNDEAISLPSEIGGKPLTKIGEGAFAENPHLKTVTIPEGVAEIERDAFAKCESLTEIMIPESVTVFGDGIFEGCPNVTILCYANSAAHAYAAANGIAYKLLTEETASVICGDLNGDGKVEASDALYVLQIVVKLKKPTAQQKEAADVDANGTVTAADALLILKKVVKLINSFPAEMK